MRVPFTGGAAQDITPDLPLYTIGGFSFSDAGNRLGFTTVTDAGGLVFASPQVPAWRWSLQ